MQSLTNYLKNSISISDELAEKLSNYFSVKHLAKGDYLNKTNSICRNLSFIEKGYVRVFVSTQDREVTQWISSPDYFITDLASFLFQTPGRWNMQALTDCTLFEINFENYLKLRQEIPAWAELDRLFIAKCFCTLEDRMFQHLHYSSEERFQQLMLTQPELFNFVPLQYIASMIGMTPETLSRLRKKASNSSS